MPNTSKKTLSVESGVYKGVVFHKRYTPTINQFTYNVTMLGIVINELDEITQQHRLFGTKWFNPVRFKQTDYIQNELGNLKQRISSKIKKLGGDWDGHKVLMIVQCRCLGMYFSPINFYYCFNSNGICSMVLTEVSNIPWNERHYYLVPMNKALESHSVHHITKKAFHVSPFMDMNMDYHWAISQPNKKMHISITNVTQNDNKKKFEATMGLTKHPFNSLALLKSWISLPFSIVKIVALIYWQAIKLFLKRVPIVSKDT